MVHYFGLDRLNLIEKCDDFKKNFAKQHKKFKKRVVLDMSLESSGGKNEHFLAKTSMNL